MRKKESLDIETKIQLMANAAYFNDTYLNDEVRLHISQDDKLSMKDQVVDLMITVFELDKDSADEIYKNYFKITEVSY